MFVREPFGEVRIATRGRIGQQDSARLGRGDRLCGIRRRRVNDRECAGRAHRAGEFAGRSFGYDDEGTLQRHDANAH